MNFVLTKDQKDALYTFQAFLADPVETVFVLAGNSGCGKSTLVRTILEQLPSFNKTAKLINPAHKEYITELTATTNKAAENLSFITGSPVRTIHSLLGLIVKTDYKVGTTTLIAKSTDILENCLIFIDEASYVDSQLLNFIFSKTKNCKIVFVGDPAQLAPVKATGVPVFDSNFTGVSLTQVVRQTKDNPIIDLSTKFRNTVNNGEFFSFKPDGHHVQCLDRDTFNAKIIQEFSRLFWRYSDSKVLAWTNKCVIGYNKAISEHITGDPDFKVGDYAVCNSYLQAGNIKTDQLVEITKISPDMERLDVIGNLFTMDNKCTAFMPKTLASKNLRIKQAKAKNDIPLVTTMEEDWVDLRAAYACTVNKAQGSTYDEVFIDLDDIRRCNSGDQIARMLYVAASRARNHVYFTGDLF